MTESWFVSQLFAFLVAALLYTVSGKKILQYNFIQYWPIFTSALA